MQTNHLSKTLAWGVHLFTACGAVAGLFALEAIVRQAWITAFWWMTLTIAIDAADGTLARLTDAKRVLPELDGALLDNMIDYFTYALVPAFFLCHSSLLEGNLRVPVASLIVISSAYQFCQSRAKTSDHFFLGFPSYWNVAVFYLFMLGLPQGLSASILLLLVVAVFVPVKYVYPSRTEYFHKVTLGLTLTWAALLVAALWSFPRGHRPFVYASTLYLVYYFVLSIGLSCFPARFARR